jgi:hypothetical protein
VLVTGPSLAPLQGAMPLPGGVADGAPPVLHISDATEDAGKLHNSLRQILSLH